MEEVHDRLDDDGGEHAEEEVEAVDGRLHRGQKQPQPVHQKIAQNIGKGDERDLDGDLVDALVHGDIALVVHFGARDEVLLVAHAAHPALLPYDVEVDDAADRRAQKPERRHREAEALAAFKAVLRLVDVAVVHGLPRTLPVAEGQQDARRLKEARDDECGKNGDGKPEDALQKVGRHRRHARVEDLHAALFVHLAFGRLERRGDEAERQRVIGEDLQKRRAVAAEELRIEEVFLRHARVNGGDDEQHDAAQHRGGDEGVAQGFDEPLERVRHQQADEQDGDDVEGSPNTKVPEIFHVRLLSEGFGSGKRAVHI